MSIVEDARVWSTSREECLSRLIPTARRSRRSRVRHGSKTIRSSQLSARSALVAGRECREGETSQPRSGETVRRGQHRAGTDMPVCERQEDLWLDEMMYPFVSSQVGRLEERPTDRVAILP